MKPASLRHLALAPALGALILLAGCGHTGADGGKPEAGDKPVAHVGGTAVVQIAVTSDGRPV